MKVESRLLNDGLTTLVISKGSKILNISSISGKATLFIQDSNSEEKEKLEIFPFNTGSNIPESFLDYFQYITTVQTGDYMILHYYYRICTEDMLDLFTIIGGKE